MALEALKQPTEEYIPQQQLDEAPEVAKKRGIDFSFLRRPVCISIVIAALVAGVFIMLVWVNAQIARYQSEQNSIVQEIAQLKDVSADLDMDIQHGTLHPQVALHGTELGMAYPPADKIHVVTVPATPELLQPGVVPVESSNWLVNSSRRLFAALSGTMSRLSSGTDGTTVR